MKRFKLIGAPVATCLLLFSFQNCGGEITPLTSVMQQQGLFDSATGGDSLTLPALLSSDALYVWVKEGTFSTNKTPIFADSASVIIAADRTITGTLVDLNSGLNGEETKVMILNNQIYAQHITDPYNYSSLAIPVPTSGDKMLISIAFGTDPDDIVVLVNGLKQTGTIVKVGTPLTASYLLKNLVLADTTHGALHEVAVYNEALAPLSLNTLARYVATSSNVSNVVYDPSLGGGSGGGGGGTTGPVATAQFLAAKAIIDANCATCHTSSSNGDFRNLTQDQFIKKGLVSAGNPAASPIYYRLSGALSGPGPMNMPQGSALPAGQVQTIADWINSIK